MPVGRCRNVTAVETLFTFWPPGPLDRAKISRRSVSLISSFLVRSANVSCDILYCSISTSSFEKLSQFVFNARIQRFTFSNELPMAGLEPARAVCGPTDFKSVASTIPPHRRCALHSKLLIGLAKLDLARSADSLSSQAARCRHPGSKSTGTTTSFQNQRATNEVCKALRHPWQ